MILKKDKPKLVIQLYKQGKTIREISKKLHMSFSPICKLIQSYEERIGGSEGPSKETQVIGLLAKGKDPVDVIRKLNMKIEEMRRIFHEYLLLNSEYTLIELRKKVGEEHYGQVIQLINVMLARNLKTERIILINENIDKIESLHEEYRLSSKELHAKALQRQVLSTEIERLQNQKTELENYVNSLKNYVGSLNITYDIMDQQVKVLDKMKADLENKIEKIKSEKEYQDFLHKVIEGVVKECEDILLDLTDKLQKVLEYRSKGRVDYDISTKISEEIASINERLNEWAKRVERGEWDSNPQAILGESIEINSSNLRRIRGLPSILNELK